MASSKSLVANSDTLVQLLAEQCSDLEKLLCLAKEETTAAQEGKFTRIWDIVSERSRIGRRLETFHRQIAELRDTLHTQGESLANLDITGRVIELANLTLLQDQHTRKLLSETQTRTNEDLINLEKSHNGTSAYLRQPSRGLSYDREF